MIESIVDTATALTSKLIALGEHLPVQAQLASMEAGDRIDALSKDVQGALGRLTAASARVSEMTEEGRYQAELALMQAKDSWTALKAQIETATTSSVEQANSALLATKETLLRESQSLVDRLEEGVKALASHIPH